MANQLDEMNPEIMEEGRDVHVIAKVIPVETSGFEKLLPSNIGLRGRKSDAQGKSVDLGGRSIIKKKTRGPERGCF